MNAVKNSIWKQACLILIVGSLIGMLVNIFHPHAVKISSQRPPLPRATDSVTAEELAPVTISDPDLNETSSSERIVIMNYQQVLQYLEQNRALLLDARDEPEFAAGHLPGALNIPYEKYFEFEETIQKLPRDKWLICYCDGPPCDLGEMLAEELKSREFPKVGVYQGGIKDWLTHDKLEKDGGNRNGS